MDFVPFLRMEQRLARDLDESDANYWWSLLYYGELITKVIAAGLVTSIGDDPDRLRYTQVYRLVRASGIGDWAQAIEEVVTGPPAQFLVPLAQESARAVTQKVGTETWQHKAVMSLAEVAVQFDSSVEPPPSRPALRQWFAMFARLRNKTRGHGAVLGSVLGGACPKLRESLDLVAGNYPLLMLPWAHLYQNLSGKFRVSYLSGQHSEVFDKLRRERSDALAPAVYLDLGRPTRVELLETDADLTDFFAPNGDFRPPRYELVSYITGATREGDANAYLSSPKDLPSAQTEGLGTLDVHGRCFTNLPAAPTGYVVRANLETQLQQVLLDERRPIITLHGPGGIGKTSLALTVLHRVAAETRFQVIVWFSARDVELLPEGPKPVRPRVLAEKDIARDYCSLLQPPKEPKFDAVSWLAHELASAGAGPTLFVFDNFETVTSPDELFTWIDERVRAPNKVLITTRLRSFNGDYQVEVAGMEDMESRELIRSTAIGLNIQQLLTEGYIAELIHESDGHPYVMRVLLGEVAKARQLVKLERIVGDREHILAALFERTYERLPVAAKRLFLTIGRWRSLVPILGLRAVVLRPQNERIDVDAAIRELEKSSLIDVHRSNFDSQEFVSAPLVAALFAQKKLRTDRFKNAIEADVQALHDFGASKETDLRHGIRPRVEQLFKAASRRATQNPAALDADLPVLQFVAQGYPDGWRLLARLFDEVGGERANERAQQAIRSFLEHEGTDRVMRRDAWETMADLARRDGDRRGELTAWAEFAESHTAADDVSYAANKINTILRSDRDDVHRGVSQTIERDERRVLVDRVLAAFEPYERSADGTTVSRMAWLCCNIGRDARAKELTRGALGKFPDNDHLRGLADRLGLSHSYD